MNAIIYKDIHDDILNENQIKNKNHYYKEYYRENVLEKIETISQQVLIFVKYMHYDPRSIEKMVKLYPKKVQVSFFNEMAQTTEYKEWCIANYNSGSLFSQSVFVEHENGDIILDKTVKNANGMVLNFEKYHFENGKLAYIFEYFDNGNPYLIISFNGTEPDEIRWDTSYFEDFDWNGLEYYKDGNIKFPIS